MWLDRHAQSYTGACGDRIQTCWLYHVQVVSELIPETQSLSNKASLQDIPQGAPAQLQLAAAWQVSRLCIISLAVTNYTLLGGLRVAHMQTNKHILLKSMLDTRMVNMEPTAQV